MPSRVYSSLLNIGLAGIFAGVIFFIIAPHLEMSSVPDTASSSAQTASVQNSLTAATNTSLTTAVASSEAPIAIATTTPTPPIIAPKASTTPVKINKTALQTPPISTTASTQASTSLPQVSRLANAYATPPESFDTVNTAARAALVNILCMPRGGSLSPISGSGVIIDPRGVILTNAHVAQYILLSESSEIDLECEIRSGSPATAQWSAQVLYIPPLWVDIHANEINEAHATGTGEHDYALLLINRALHNEDLPASFPYLPYDTRDAVAFLGDQMLGASYPAEFLGGLAAENDLYPVSSISPIQQLLTFATTSVDVVALGGVIEAQSGSSGGPVVNQWGRLVGLISTTSDAPTTGGRDLRAITLSYINRDIQDQTGSDISSLLSGDLSAKEYNFTATVAPGLIQKYIQILSQ